MKADAPIDPIAVARAILADPRKKFTMSVLQINAICTALVAAEDNPQPVITDDLAQAARALIAVHEGFAQRAEALGAAQAQAVSDAIFKTFKTTFEQEFPNE